MAIYRAPASAGTLAATVDGGHPRRQRGPCERITYASQTRKLADDGVQAKLGRGNQVLTRALTTLVLGDDLAPGQHVVDIHYDGPERVWVRFWTPGKRAKRERVSLWVSQEATE
jgi:hypothetical protein